MKHLHMKLLLYDYRKNSLRLHLTLLGLSLFCGCTSTRRHVERYEPHTSKTNQGAFVVDAGGRPITHLESGSSLYVGASKLRPHATYEFRLSVGQRATASLEQAVSFARSTTDQQGDIPPLVLWYQSGVIGCSPRPVWEGRTNHFIFRTFEEAERTLAGQTLVVSVHPVSNDPKGRVPPMKLKVGEAVSVVSLPIQKRRSPLVYASDKTACLLNSQRNQEVDFYVSGRNFIPGEMLQVSIVPYQRVWNVGDP